MAGLLGPDGLPIKKETLIREHAAPTVTGVRSIRREGIAKGLDPSSLGKLIKEANEGNNDQMLTLAEEMEERDPHYASVLGQRKRAVSLIEPIVTGNDDKMVEAIELLVSRPAFSEMIDDALDGIAKGYSCTEIIWELGADEWKPSRYLHRDPHFFTFDRETLSELRIKDEAYPDGKEIPPYSMIVHAPRLKTGLKLRNGLARLVSWAFMLKSFTLQDWAAFLEVFGMPLRVGKYDDQAGPEEKRTLLRAVRDLGSDAAAIIPKGMEVEFIEAKGGQGNAVFGAMADYLDKQVSKAVLGQTMTTDDGSSLAQASVHEDVKIDIKKSDARQLGATINRDLIATYVAFNYGPDVEAPVVSFPVEDPEDIKTMSEALEKLVPMGLRVSMADVRKKVGFAAPADDEDVLFPPRTLPANKEPGQPAAPEQASARKACLHCGEVHLAGAQSDEIDMLVEDGLSHWQADMQPLFDQVSEIAFASSGYEDFIQRLNKLNPDTANLARTMAIQAMKARGDGDLGGGNG
jgi:phage gp29-like protein